MQAMLHSVVLTVSSVFLHDVLPGKVRIKTLAIIKNNWLMVVVRGI